MVVYIDLCHYNSNYIIIESYVFELLHSLRFHYFMLEMLFYIHFCKVSTGTKSREPPRALVSAEKATLPGDAGLLHAELTFFYYPGDVYFPGKL